MSLSEQQPPIAFIKFFEEKPDLFEPLKDLPNIAGAELSAETSDYEPANDTERRLMAIVKDHKAKVVEEMTRGRFSPIRALLSPDQTLIVYREILGRISGRPLEGGVRVGIYTGINMLDEFDGIYRVFGVIKPDGLDRMATGIGHIYLGLLNDPDKRFLEENYFPVDRIPEILKPYLR